MRVRNITTCALGLAAALTLVASPLAAQQQDTTRLRTTSETRIMTSKGEVVTTPPRVDTVYVTRYDTVRVDNTIVRVDTVTVTPPAPVIVPRMTGPMYWGLYGGSSWPWGNVDRVYTNGFHFGGVLGWEPQHGFLGARLDGAMSQWGREDELRDAGFGADQIGSGTALLLHLAGDLKVKPLNFGGWALYGIGGLNYNRYKRVALVSDNDGGGGGSSTLSSGGGGGGSVSSGGASSWASETLRTINSRFMPLETICVSGNTRNTASDNSTAPTMGASGLLDLVGGL